MSATYSQVYGEVTDMILARANNITLNNISQDIRKFSINLNIKEICFILCSLFLFVTARYVIENYVFKPLCAPLVCNLKYLDKACDSGFKLICHVSRTLLAIKILFGDDCTVCFNKFDHKYSETTPLPALIKLYYFLQMSYYLEGFYSELIDSSKKKAVQMVLIIFHHIVSLVLIFGSYMSRTHDVGLVMAFLHDMNDIFLDCPKLCHALREPKGPIRPQFKLIYILCIVVLPITWIVSRLYYFPLNAMYRALFLPCTYSLIVMLHIFMQLIMVTNIIWTVWMAIFYYQIITGKEIEDPMTESVEKNQ